MCVSVEPRWAGFLAHLLFPRFPSSLLLLHRQAGSPGPPRAVHHPSPQGCGKRSHTEHAYGIPTYALPRTVVTFRMTFTPPSYTHSSLRDPRHPTPRVYLLSVLAHTHLLLHRIKPRNTPSVRETAMPPILAHASLISWNPIPSAANSCLFYDTHH